MITRRKFLATTSLSALALTLLPKMLGASPSKKQIGLQLYTVRDHISKDLPGTLEQISEIGYTWLEAAGYNDGKFYGLAPAAFKKMVDDLGMKVISSHVGFKPEESNQVIDAHLELGTSYVVFPWMSIPDQPNGDDYAHKATLFNQLGEACSKAKMKFGYHNHDFEFKKIGETTGYDILLNKTDPDLVCFEADIYWMIFAGKNPIDYFKQYHGRFELWHVKDMEDSTERNFTEVGEGIIPIRAYFEKSVKKSGMNYFFVEQDSCKRDPLESVAISFSNLWKIIND